MADNWSREEVEAAVEDHFAMLAKELCGKPFNKAEHNRGLQKILTKRTKGSIERNHQNISAILIELGYPYVDELLIHAIGPGYYSSRSDLSKPGSEKGLRQFPAKNWPYVTVGFRGPKSLLRFQGGEFADERLRAKTTRGSRVVA